MGLGRYIDEDGECSAYDRKKIRGELRRRLQTAECNGLALPTGTPLAHNLARLGKVLEGVIYPRRFAHCAPRSDLPKFKLNPRY